MKNNLKILGICGSLRAASYNLALLRTAVEFASRHRMAIEIFSGLAEIPPYNGDVEAVADPGPVTALKQSIREADGLLFATPEYNYNVPGVLKNAVDWASRPPSGSVLNDKPAAIMGASMGGGGSARAQLALRQSFVFTRTPAMLQPELLLPKAQNLIDASGILHDEGTRKHLDDFLGAFAEWVERFRSAERRAA